MRLEKSGISQADYESGQSIQKARGHAATPEHPRDYNPVRYAAYHQSRTSLEAQLEDRKRQLWGDSPRWSDNKSQDNIRKYPPTLAQIRWALQADDEDIIDAIRENPDTYKFLYYH